MEMLLEVVIPMLVFAFGFGLIITFFAWLWGKLIFKD